ncbi:MAG TPA: hypothetical protein VJ836_07250 [Candidatus Saccharimonadales bacterium]|nr:hypothetical protein [Candidatus Saccharimonadales bacterium]
MELGVRFTLDTRANQQYLTFSPLPQMMIDLTTLQDEVQERHGVSLETTEDFNVVRVEPPLPNPEAVQRFARTVLDLAVFVTGTTETDILFTDRTGEISRKWMPVFTGETTELRELPSQ